MLKREIKYLDFDGNPQVEECWFHINKSEAFELQGDFDEDLQDMIKRIIAEKDMQSLLKLFKRIVLMAYGVRSEDGKRFIKSEQLREEFSQTAAFDALYMELATSDNAAAEFIIGALPKDMQESAQAEISKAPLAPPSIQPTEAIN